VCLGREGAHVAVPSERVLAVLLGRLQHGGGVGVLQQHVGALVDELLRGRAFLLGVEPAADPDDTRLDLRVDALRSHRERVDVAQHFGDGEAADKAQGVGLRHAAGDDAADIGVMVETCVVDAHVDGRLVAGGMLELDVRKLAGHLDHGVHVAEAGGEDDLVALGCQITDHPLAVDQLFEQNSLAAEVMRESPAGIADRTDVDPCRLQGLGLGCARGNGSRRGGCRRFFLLAATGQHGRRSQASQRKQAAGHQIVHEGKSPGLVGWEIMSQGERVYPARRACSGG